MVRDRAFVLCYHALSHDWSSPLSVAPTVLRGHLVRLLDSGYEPVTFSRLVLNPPPHRAVAVTFDDGFRSVLDLALPVLRDLGAVATVFVPTDFPDRGALAWPGVDPAPGITDPDELRSLDWPALGRLGAAGWEIASHTCSHPSLTGLPDAELERELVESRRRCGDSTGTECRAIAYPYGHVDDRVEAAARRAGFLAGAALRDGPRRARPLRWPRVEVYRGDGWLRLRTRMARAAARAR